jgi:tubulin-specific chaperone A
MILNIGTHFFLPAGVVRRCGKEKLSYRKEVDMQKEKVEKMKAEGRDEYEIRKMNEVS